MFEKDGLNAIYREHKKTLNKINAVADALRARFFQMDDAIECLMVAALSGEAMVMIGPPGTAKSRLIRSFCNLIGLIPDGSLTGDSSADEKQDAYFEYLLTQFTEPSELFGFYDLAALQSKSELVRKDENMMQKAQVVFLDEVFNASSAILNSLLTFMNERKFHDRGDVIETPLQLLVSATNHPPQEATLAAVYDRFLLRCRVRNVASEGVDQGDIVALLQAGWQETHAAKLDSQGEWRGLLTSLKALQNDINTRTRSNQLKIDPLHPMMADLTEMVSKMVKYELSDMSNRRLIKLAGLVLSVRLLRGAKDGAEEIEMQVRDLDVIARFSLDRDDPSAQARLLSELDRS
jgi:MoxR-like ATPase